MSCTVFIFFLPPRNTYVCLTLSRTVLGLTSVPDVYNCYSSDDNSWRKILQWFAKMTRKASEHLVYLMPLSSGSSIILQNVVLYYKYVFECVCWPYKVNLGKVMQLPFWSAFPTLLSKVYRVIILYNYEVLSSQLSYGVATMTYSRKCKSKLGLYKNQICTNFYPSL